MTDEKIKTRNDVTLFEQENGVSILVAKSYDKAETSLFNVTESQPLSQLKLPKNSRVYATPDGAYVHAFQDDTTVHTVRVDSGEVYGQVVTSVRSKIRTVDVTNRYVTFTLEQAPGPVVVDALTSDVIHRFQLQARCAAISKDEQYLATNNSDTVHYYVLPLMERKCAFKTPEAAEKIKFSARNSQKFYLMTIACDLKSVSINLSQRKPVVNDILRDIEMKDFALSNTEEHFLVRSSRCVYFYDTKSEFLRYRFTGPPIGVYLDQLSTFVDAQFSSGDAYVIAARHVYVMVWSCSTGQPVRVLHTAVSPVMKMFVGVNTKQVVTLLEEGTISLQSESHACEFRKVELLPLD